MDRNLSFVVLGFSFSLKLDCVFHASIIKTSFKKVVALIRSVKFFPQRFCFISISTILVIIFWHFLII